MEVAWVEVRERSIAPYSLMEATVRAHTHWGGGLAARAVLHSPQAPPSAPRAPRIYVQSSVRYMLFVINVTLITTELK